MTRARDLADSADKDIAGTLTLDDLSVSGTASVTGDFTVDTDTLYVDTTNDRVGIGTNAPDTPLEVQRSSSGNALKLSSSTDGASVYLAFEQQESGTQYVRSRIRAASNGVDGGLIFETGSSGSMTEAIRIDSSGNVGIGTTSPSRLLDVSDTNTPNVIIQTTATSGEDAALRIRGSRTTSTSGDLAQILFETNDEDAAGDSLAFITAGKDTPSTNLGVIRFGTTTTNGGTPTEHMRINSSGVTKINELKIAGSSRIIEGYESGTATLTTGNTNSSYNTYSTTGMNTAYMTTHNINFASSFTGTPKVFVYQYDGNNAGHGSIKRFWADAVSSSGFSIIVGDEVGSSGVAVNWIAIRDKS